MVHSVAPVTNQQGWGNVMYIPAAPWCPRNERYAASVRDAFRTGSSPTDFPDEHYERTWPDRFQPADLNEIGRRGLGLLEALCTRRAAGAGAVSGGETAPTSTPITRPPSMATPCASRRTSRTIAQAAVTAASSTVTRSRAFDRRREDAHLSSVCL